MLCVLEIDSWAKYSDDNQSAIVSPNLLFTFSSVSVDLKETFSESTDKYY